MNNERQIASVNSNLDKYNTYRVLIGRYRKAIAGEFYLEALLIDYALLEDRLRSYLYYMGVLSTRTEVGIPAIAKKNIGPIVVGYKVAKENDSLGVKNITDKMKIIRCVLQWSSEVTESEIGDNNYLIALKRQCESVDIAEILDTLESINVWKYYRNEVIHGLMNKNLESLDEGLYDAVIKGKRYSEILDNQLKVFKKGNVVRRAAKLPKDQ